MQPSALFDLVNEYYIDYKKFELMLLSDPLSLTEGRRGDKWVEKYAMDIDG